MASFMGCVVAGWMIATPASSATDAIFEKGPHAGHRIALSFDVDGNAATVQALANGLSNRQVHATFFVSGEWARSHPGTVRELDRAGHEIALAPWDAAAFTTWSSAEIVAQIQSTRGLLTGLLGHPPVSLVRVPPGLGNARMRRILGEIGVRPVAWKFDGRDREPGRGTPQHVFDRLVSATEEQLGGAVVLLHAGSPATAEALPFIIDALRERGFHFVKVSELIRVSTWAGDPRSNGRSLLPPDHCYFGELPSRSGFAGIPAVGGALAHFPTREVRAW